MNRKFWNAHVLVRLILPLIIGIGLSRFVSIQDISIIWALLVCAVLLCFGASLLSVRSSYRWLIGIPLFIAFILFGFANSQLQNSKIPTFINGYEPKSKAFAAEVIQHPTRGDRSTKLLVQIKKHPQNELLGKQMVVYLSNQRTDSLSRGDIILAKHFINEIAPPKNPHEFHYRNYMQQQGILYQTYLGKSKEIEVLRATKRQKSIIEQLRNTGFRFVNKHISKNNQGIAKALLFGYRDELSRDTANEFAKSGTMHVLAVSGLHVGIIFLLASLLLKIIERNIRIPKFIKVVLLLIVIWIFVFLTGAKASVSRAGIMFSLFVIGMHFFIKMYSLNTLAFAAIILLTLWPNYLFDVGFQLSFSAVAGIVLLVPTLQRLFPVPKWKFVKYFLDITYVSIAAQLATLPFTIYYFQQFPTLGLIANLFAIPLAFAIVAVGFVGFLLSFIPVLSMISGQLLDYLLSLLQVLNSSIADLSFSTIQNLYLTQFEFIVLLSAVFCLFIFAKSKYNQMVFASILGFIVLATSIAFQKWQVFQKQEFLVYSVNQNIIAQIQNGRTVHLFSKNQISDGVFSYSILPNWKANYIQEKNFYSLTDSVKGTEYALKNKLLFLPHETIQFVGDDINMSSTVDLVIADRLNYQELLKAKREMTNQRIILSNNYPNRSVPDSTEHLHFSKTEGHYRIEF